jgi:hypothetical protein
MFLLLQSQKGRRMAAPLKFNYRRKVSPPRSVGFWPEAWTRPGPVIRLPRSVDARGRAGGGGRSGLRNPKGSGV